jgi:hypothetical protein
MIRYVDNESKVRAVDTTTDTSLTPLYVDETADLFPFKGWRVAKICCYKVTVVDGIVTMMTPYVDSRCLEFVDQMGHSIDDITPYTETKKAYYNESEKTFYGVPDGNISVLFSNYNGDHKVSRVADRVIVSFAKLTDTTNITIEVK